MNLKALPNIILRNKKAQTFFYLISFLFFLFFVFAPAAYLILLPFLGGFASYVGLGSLVECFPPNLQELLTLEIAITDEMFPPLITSFQIAFLALIVDLVFGVPMAWLINRYNFPGKNIFNALIDMPLVVPTAALGFSVALFWGGAGLGILDKGFWLIALLHIVFTFPYVVRTVSAAIEEIDIIYERAGRTLGASPLTAFRTVAAPLFKDGLMIGGILAFTRSLSETGATMMVAGIAEKTATIAALGYKNAGNMGGAVSVSIVLIIISVILLALVKYYAGKRQVSMGKIYPRFEKYLSGPEFGRVVSFITFGFLGIFLAWVCARFFFLSNMGGIGLIFIGAILFVAIFAITLSRRYKVHWTFLLCSAVFLLFVLFPSFFFVSSLQLEGEYGAIFSSLIISFTIALSVTAINLLFGIPMAFLIARHTAGGIADTLIDVVMVIPTVALGISLSMFWGKTDEMLIVMAAHISFTYPYIVKPITAAIRGLRNDLEEAAYSLGATPMKVFSTITFPLILPSILAGATMAFMRSMSETGATLAISEKVKTVPILIVDLVKANMNAEAAFASFILLVISLFAVSLLRRK